MDSQRWPLLLTDLRLLGLKLRLIDRMLLIVLLDLLDGLRWLW